MMRVLFDFCSSECFSLKLCSFVVSFFLLLCTKFSFLKCYIKITHSSKIRNIEFVKNIHELHVWTLDEGKYICTLHFTIKPNTSFNINQIKEIMHGYDIHSTTIQPEFGNDIDEIICNEIICDISCNSKKCCENISEI